jgi:DNA-binding IscR family transcriptional regulator
MSDTDRVLEELTYNGPGTADDLVRRTGLVLPLLRSIVANLQQDGMVDTVTSDGVTQYVRLAE